MKRIMLLIVVLSLATLALASAPQAEPGLLLSTPYPAQEIVAGENLNIDLTLKSVGLDQQVVALETAGIPEGWTAKFAGGGRAIHSVFVDGETPAEFELNLEIPRETAAQVYELEVIARGQDAMARLPLELTVGEGLPPALSVESELPVLRGSPSSTFNYRVKITNDAEEDAMAALTYEAPEGFSVTFKTAGQEVTSVPVPAGQNKTIDVAVDAPDQVAAG
jgi:uncharacterized membrane protein